ncbi:tetratricopeptide repeat protein [Clostridium gasigenes]|uniref:Ig-like domain (Group 4) n=1 Tax=Clostridium gasigenes TaxID=94869 RepID=A0A1H0TIF7_9CLOT|nr:Ig-like domain-containing protein [Clostridium gasigenes]SDP53635.1 Ig-like domain (group 4) [Clostridium gasigenes]
MVKQFKAKKSTIFLSLLLISTFVSCSKIDKETILSPNVTEDIKVEENEVKVTLEKGNSYLNDNDFANAKLTYEKATSIDKVNKDIYLQIKDKYLELTRFDDALYFVQLALNNNTDIDNMKIISDNIKSKFEITSIDKSLYEGESYTLPSELSTKINNENVSIPVTWNNSVINTSTAGTFSYLGTNKEYSRQFNATLTVVPPIVSAVVPPVVAPVIPSVVDEEHCYVKNIYKSNGKTYIDVDLVEFLRGNAALEGAIKDNNSKVGTNDDGSKFVPDSYYIRDNVHTQITYEVSQNSTFNLAEFHIYPNSSSNGTITVPVPYDRFESYIKSHINGDYRPNLCLIKFKNNVVYDVSYVYTP